MDTQLLFRVLRLGGGWGGPAGGVLSGVTRQDHQNQAVTVTVDYTETVN